MFINIFTILSVNISVRGFFTKNNRSVNTQRDFVGRVKESFVGLETQNKRREKKESFTE